VSAGATVLSFRYRVPRAICPINPKASKPIQHFFDAFEGEGIPTSDVLYGLRDRITREDWIKQVGTGARP
jgi:hypothetical protein